MTAMDLPPTVAIGIPSHDVLHADFAMALASMVANSRMRTVLINSKGCYVSKGRNNCVQIAQEKGATHLLFLDSDMIFPADTLIRLLAHKKDIVGCVYSRRVAPFTNLGTPKDKSTGQVSGKDTLIEMDMLPTGVMLIDMRCFQRIDRPYFRFWLDEARQEEMGEDVYFCQRMRTAGFRLWADVPLSLQVGHIGQAIYRVQEETKAEAYAVGQAQQRVFKEDSIAGMEAAE